LDTNYLTIKPQVVKQIGSSPLGESGKEKTLILLVLKEFLVKKERLVLGV
jgi:hypothetical protein